MKNGIGLADFKWIPAKKELPQINNYTSPYLVTLSDGRVVIANYTESDNSHWWSVDSVVAWMELPEAYKGDTT